MANTSRINGFKPVMYLNGSPWNGKARAYVVPASNATALFVGDLVKQEGSGDAVTGLTTVIQAVAGDATLGPVVGIEVSTPTFDSGTSHGAVTLDTPLYRLASTRRIVYVADDRDIVFEVQEDAVGGALAVASIGLNANFIVGAGSTTTGASGMQLDTSTAATTAALPLKILGFVRREDNEFAVANAKVLVKINNHQLGAGTGTAGV